ncbi:glycosyltransferase [Erythrobacter neustonensis]|uniref:Glycosyl transferase family 2 n=1 Tax=Erythrobacter neustonensis TaxID=1112 RepID=A0A192D225_9SPHN|nr:glycosyltransferase [Erythrobacter neustonensis]ANK12036.1 glycosyl transferase family 2 [Erythrobacter neustonensis]
MYEMHPFTVIIPAHNEEAVIGRCLKRIQDGAPAGAMEIIVAANGCTDRTVEVAHAAGINIVVLDLPTGSKTAAINAANGAATHFPRIYVDADVECGFASLNALAQALREPGVMTAAPSIRMNLDRCNIFMKAYYRAWSRQPYAKAGKGGAGIYGLSAAALEAVGSFPPIIGDDIWIHTRFPDEQKRYIAQDERGQKVFSVVYPPRTAREQIRVEARRRIGNQEVQNLYPSAYLANANNGGGWKAALISGTGAFDLMVFLTIKIAARSLAHWNRKRGKAAAWARDMSTRQAA